MRTPYLCLRADPQTLLPLAAPFTRSFDLQALSPCACKLLLLGPSRFSSLALQGFSFLALQGFSFLAPCAFTFLLPCSSCFCYSAYLPALRLLVRICFCHPTSQFTQQSLLAACINLLEACWCFRSRSLWFSRALFHCLQLALTCSKLASVAPAPGLFGSGLRSPTARSLLLPPLLQVSLVQPSDLPRLVACFPLSLTHRLQLAFTCSKLASAVPGAPPLAACIYLFKACFRRPWCSRSLWFSSPISHDSQLASAACNLHPPVQSLLPPPLVLQVSLVQLTDLPRLAACFHRLLSRSLCFHPKLSPLLSFHSKLSLSLSFLTKLSLSLCFRLPLTKLC